MFPMGCCNIIKPSYSLEKDQSWFLSFSMSLLYYDLTPLKLVVPYPAHMLTTSGEVSPRTQAPELVVWYQTLILPCFRHRALGRFFNVSVLQALTR